MQLYTMKARAEKQTYWPGRPQQARRRSTDPGRPRPAWCRAGSARRRGTLSGNSASSPSPCPASASCTSLCRHLKHETGSEVKPEIIRNRRQTGIRPQQKTIVYQTLASFAFLRLKIVPEKGSNTGSCMRPYTSEGHWNLAWCRKGSRRKTSNKAVCCHFVTPIIRWRAR